MPPPDKFNINNLPLLKKLREAYKLWHNLLKHFPKSSRYTLGADIDKKFVSLIDTILFALYASKETRKEIIGQASNKLDNLKYWLQASWEFKLIDHKNYGSISALLSETGKMIGSWLKQVQK